MTNEAMQLVSALHAWHKVIRKRVVMSGHVDSEALDTADELRRAADMIERLSAERDAWQRRAETAEQDLHALMKKSEPIPSMYTQAHLVYSDKSNA